MLLDLATIAPKQIYTTMIQCIVPRPVAWVLSDNGDQTLNLAPFSYFNGVSSKPPILSLSVGKKRDGSRKDTWVNIDEREHFVVHIAHPDLAGAVSATAASLPFGSSEVTENDLSVRSVEGWSLPRLTHARIAMLCCRHQIIEVGDTPQGLILGRLEQVYVDDAIATPGPDGGVQIDATQLDPLARLGGDDYGALGRTFTVERPA